MNCLSDGCRHLQRLLILVGSVRPDPRSKVEAWRRTKNQQAEELIPATKPSSPATTTAIKRRLDIVTTASCRVQLPATAGRTT